jgi:hypothetical protein
MVLELGHSKKYISYSWVVLKFVPREGWRRSIGQTESERKKYYVK